MPARTRARVFSETGPLSFSTRDTVAGQTPISRATSVMVIAMECSFMKTYNNCMSSGKILLEARVNTYNNSRSVGAIQRPVRRQQDFVARGRNYQQSFGSREDW